MLLHIIFNNIFSIAILKALFIKVFVKSNRFDILQILSEAESEKTKGQLHIVRA